MTIEAALPRRAAARLHVTFGGSAAGSLKQALARLRCPEEVVPLDDDLSTGPLDPGDAAQRAAWERDELDQDDPVATSDAVGARWDKVSRWAGPLIAWMSSRSVGELCGLHALAWRLPAADIHVVDVARVAFRPGAAPPYDERQAFGILRADRIVEHGLLDTALPLDDVARASLRERWQQLRHDNAPLRVLTDEGLVSAPIDHFDDELRARATETWQACGRIVRAVLATQARGRWRACESDVFLFARLLRLVDGGALELHADDEASSLDALRIRRRSR